jgi:hypothetical protein
MAPLEWEGISNSLCPRKSPSFLPPLRLSARFDWLLVHSPSLVRYLFDIKGRQRCPDPHTRLHLGDREREEERNLRHSTAHRQSTVCPWLHSARIERSSRAHRIERWVRGIPCGTAFLYARDTALLLRNVINDGLVKVLGARPLKNIDYIVIWLVWKMVCKWLQKLNLFKCSSFSISIKCFQISPFWLRFSEKQPDILVHWQTSENYWKLQRLIITYE